MRLDQYLVTNQLAKTRNEAAKMIADGLVLVNQEIATKNNLNITNQEVIVTGEIKYVSRAGLKLQHAIETFQLDLRNNIVLDIGSSTGGFADVCLQHQAQCVYCVDVGIDQLHPKIRNDPRVINLEKTNIKNLNTSIIPDHIDLVVCDLSFISSKHMFESLQNLHLKTDCNIISLIKPQFELSKTIIDHCNAKVTNPRHFEQAINHVKQYALTANLKIMDVISSPIKGAKKQNQEFLIWCKYGQ